LEQLWQREVLILAKGVKARLPQKSGSAAGQSCMSFPFGAPRPDRAKIEPGASGDSGLSKALPSQLCRRSSCRLRRGLLIIGDSKSAFRVIRNVGDGFDSGIRCIFAVGRLHLAAGHAQENQCHSAGGEGFEKQG
jgi:hypothetical protein